jgi:caffeoyl-CoA O-methyltransferase
MTVDHRSKNYFLAPELETYLVSHSTQPDALQQRLIDETRQAAGGWADMQVAAEQGVLLTILCRLMGAGQAIELGTFFGYSALCIARGLRPGGRLLTCDIDEKAAAIAQRYWAADGIADKIDLRLGPALPTLRSLPPDPVVDFAFLDADKPNYPLYYEELLARLRPGGVLVVDNVFAHGGVVGADTAEHWAPAICAFNEQLAADERVDKVMLAVSDGITIVQKR